MQRGVAETETIRRRRSGPTIAYNTAAYKVPSYREAASERPTAAAAATRPTTTAPAAGNLSAASRLPASA